MCKYCDSVAIDDMKSGEPVEEIMYNEYYNEYYLVAEQSRYDRTRVLIKYCPWCGRRLNNLKEK